MPTVLWDVKWATPIDFLEKGSTVNRTSYCQFIIFILAPEFKFEVSVFPSSHILKLYTYTWNINTTQNWKSYYESWLKTSYDDVISAVDGIFYQ